MKQTTKTWIAAWVLSLISICSFAQEKQTKIPEWVSDKGYWVVESNTHAPLNHIVWFYNNDNLLIYKETVSGVKLDPYKKRVKMKLKKALEASMVAWERAKNYEEDKNYVAAILK